MFRRTMHTQVNPRCAARSRANFLNPFEIKQVPGKALSTENRDGPFCCEVSITARFCDFPPKSRCRQTKLTFSAWSSAWLLTGVPEDLIALLRTRDRLRRFRNTWDESRSCALQILDQLYDIPADQRVGFLAEACGEDDLLRKQVQRMLLIQDESTNHTGMLGQGARFNRSSSCAVGFGS